MTPPQAGKIRDFLHITPQVRNEVSQLQSLSPSPHQVPSSHILGIWGWGEVDDGYRGDCEGGERRMRKQMEKEKEVEVWGRDQLSWVGVLS